MKQLITIITLYLTGTVIGQETNLEWYNQYEGTGSSFPCSVVLDSDNNLYTLGNFVGDMDFDLSDDEYILESTPGLTPFITKTDPNGDLVWAKMITSTTTNYTRQLVIDEDNNVTIIGFFSENIDADPDEIEEFILEPTVNGVSEVFVIQLNSDGEFLWATNFGYSEFEIIPFGSFYVDNASASADGIFLGGRCFGEFNFETADGPVSFAADSLGAGYVLKIGDSGVIQWVKFIDGSEEETVRAEVNGDALYLYGTFTDVVDFDLSEEGTNIQTSLNGHSDAFIGKYDLDGNLEWINSFGSFYGDDEATALTFDYLGNPCLAGVVGDWGATYTMNDVTVNLDHVGGMSTFMLKLQSNGTPIWGRSFGGSIEANLQTAVTDGVNNYLYIEYVGDFDVDPDPTITDIVSAPFDNDQILLIKLNFDGGLLWAGEQQGWIFGLSHAAIDVDQDENLFGAIGISQTSDIDPNEEEEELVTNTTAADHFIYKLNTSGTLNLIPPAKLGYADDVYPNPVSTNLNVPITREVKGINIYGLNGELLLSGTQQSINVSTLAGGVYIIAIETESGISKQKFTKL